MDALKKRGKVLMAALALLMGAGCGTQATPRPVIVVPPSNEVQAGPATAIVTVIPATQPPTETVEAEPEASPTEANQATTATEADTPAAPAEGWVEYRDPAYGYGLAAPCQWTIYPTLGPALVSSMTMSSYDEDYFLAHSVKGGWDGGSPPDGAYKIDMIVMEEIPTGQPLAEAARERLNGEFSSVQSVSPVKAGANQAVSVITVDPNHTEETFKSLVFRLAPDKIMIMSPSPQEAWDSSDVQAMLRSLTLSEDGAVVIPTVAPQEPIIPLPERCQ